MTRSHDDVAVAEPVGHTRWVIAEGWIPGWSHGPAPTLTTHETACILNAGPVDAHIRVTVFFENREPSGPYTFTVGARRTRHQRFNELRDRESIPTGTDYSTVIESHVPIVVQHTRLDSRSPLTAPLSTMAYPA
jgi:hypothetical protein